MSMVDESKLSFSFSFSFVLTSLSELTKKTPWAILRGSVALRGALTTSDLGLWVVRWFLVGSPVFMTLLERRMTMHVDSQEEGLAVWVTWVRAETALKSERN
jgi:hypothetical protein